jgi:hypothetical protein
LPCRFISAASFGREWSPPLHKLTLLSPAYIIAGDEGWKGMRNMEEKELIVKEIENLPESYLIEILDFIRFLKNKVWEEKMELALASEVSLKKDWLKPEEDEAWKDL